MANYGPPLLDFSWLGQAGDTLGKAFKDRRDTNALLDAYDASQQGLNSLGQPVPAGLSALGQSGPAAPATPAPAGESLARLGDVFARTEAERGLPQGYLQRVASIESRGNPNAQNPNSSAGGLFQFIDSTAKQYGLANKNDPIASTEAAGRLAADNKAVLAQALGREPTAGELYLAHQQGAGGAAKLLANPNAPAESVVGVEAARLNGGAGLTAGQFAQKWIGKVDGGQPQVAQADLPAQGAVNAEGFAVPQGAQPATRQNVNGQMIRSLLANPGTRDIGKQLWAQTLTGRQFGFQVVGDQLYRTNPSTGQVEPVGVSKPVQPVTVSPGQRLVDPRTGQVVYQGANDSFRNLVSPEERAAAGIQPDDKRPYQIGPDGKLSSPGGTTVNNNLPSAEKAQDQVIGKAYGEQFVESQKSARDASKTLGTINMMEKLIQTPGFYSGLGADRSLTLNRALVSLGIKDAKAATAQEAFQALSNQIVLDAAGGSLGAQISNGDRDYINATAPNLANTPEGNKELLGIRRKLAERQSLVGKMARDYAKSNGGRLDAGFDEQLTQFAEANPLFSKVEAPAAPSGPPSVGDIRKGFRFKGGDPSQQSSWEKAQ